MKWADRVHVCACLCLAWRLGRGIWLEEGRKEGSGVVEVSPGFPAVGGDFATPLLELPELCIFMRLLMLMGSG